MTQTTLRGSCLCGSVQYEITGTPTRFYHCHCSRCRKSSGTGHASNLFLQPASIRWIKGEELLRTFKPPEAKRFTRQFCGNCGSGVARQVKDSDAVIVPAGSLDNEPPIKPQARIFWDSRVSWSCGGDGIPTYPESAT
jgi:hypothetical protein